MHEQVESVGVSVNEHPPHLERVGVRDRLRVSRTLASVHTSNAGEHANSNTRARTRVSCLIR